MSDLATLAEHRPSGTGADSFRDLRLRSASVLNASTTSAAERPAHSLHVQPGVGFMPPEMVAYAEQGEFGRELLVGGAGVAVLLNSAWEDGSVVTEETPTRIVASGTNYMVAGAKPSLSDYLSNYSDNVIFATTPGPFVETLGAFLLLHTSGDLVLSGELNVASREPADGSTECVSPSSAVNEDASEFDALPSSAVLEVVDPALISERLRGLVSLGDGVVFRDGMYSPFSRCLHETIEEFGRAAVDVIEDAIGEGAWTPALVGEAMRWIGDMDHVLSAGSRRRLLTMALHDDSPIVREGAVLGLLYLGGPLVKAPLVEALRTELHPEIRRSIEDALEDLGS